MIYSDFLSIFYTMSTPPGQILIAMYLVLSSLLITAEKHTNYLP